MADKKPYVMVDASKIELINTGVLSEFSKELHNSKSLREAIDRFIEKKSTDSMWAKMLPKDRGEILSQLPDVEVVQEGSPTYRSVESALSKYNATYPNKKLKMPSNILEGNLGGAGALYSALGDLMIVDKKGMNDLTPKELEAVLVHEFKHKVQFASPEFAVPMYNGKAHADAYVPEVFAACKKSGLSDREIAVSLPSDKYAHTLMSLPLMFGDVDPDAVLTLARMETRVKWLKHPIDRLSAKIKAAIGKDDCPDAIAKVHATQGKAFRELRKDSLAQARARESDADMAAKAAGLAPEMCEALKKIHTVTYGNGKQVLLDIEPEKEQFSDHPTLDNRLNALNCPLPPKVISKKDTDKMLKP